MKKLWHYLLIGAFFITALFLLMQCTQGGEEDSEAPTPGGSGIITVTDFTSSSVTLAWEKATDNSSEQSTLQYRVYFSQSPLESFFSMAVSGTASGDWEVDIDSMTVSGLNPSTLYYFTVLVKDEAGNTATYNAISQETSSGEELEGQVPVHKAEGVGFADSDFTAGEIGGTVEILKALDESDVTHYMVYLSADGITRLEGTEAIASLEKTGEDLSFSINPDTPLYGGATHFLVITKNENGEMEEGVSAAIEDRGTTLSITFPANLPSNCTSLDLLIEGYEGGPFSESYPIDQEEVTLDLPDGYTVDITATSSTPSATFSAAAEGVELNAGAMPSVPLTLALTSTRLVIPDANNNRIVQIDDMSGSNWTEVINEDIGYEGEFTPYDVDFDAQGRIYIGIYGGEGQGSVIRLDDINDTEFDEIVSSVRIKAIAVDRVNNYLYYYDDNYQDNLYRENLSSPGDPESIDLNYEIQDVEGYEIEAVVISGLSVDENGFVYAAMDYNGYVFQIDFDGGTGNIVTRAYEYGLSVVWDVITKENYVYVLNSKNQENSAIVQFERDNPDMYSEYGDYVTVESSAPGEFFGPHRFVAVLNRKFYITDEYSGSGLRKLVAYDDYDFPSWSGWETYGSYGSGEGQFLFYSYC